MSRVSSPAKPLGLAYLLNAKFSAIEGFNLNAFVCNFILVQSSENRLVQARAYDGKVDEAHLIRCRVEIPKLKEVNSG